MFTYVFLRVVSNYQAVRGKKSAEAQYRLQPDWFVTKTPSHSDQGLTANNEDFVKEVVRETYRNQGSMLKEEMMERQEYGK